MKIAAAQFDTHPYLINCLNGTYDLEHMKFREHRWDDFLTMQTNFEYTLQEVTCPRWEQFIKEVTQNEADKADYLQRALGYSILGTSKEECMFILHGKTTRNGKSTMLDAKLSTTTSSGGLILALQRAITTARPEGRYRKHCYWLRYKAVLLESSLLESSACSLIYFCTASSVILPIVST